MSMRLGSFFILIFFLHPGSYGQVPDSLSRGLPEQLSRKTSTQFTYCAEFMDAAINSFHSFQGLVKKENYRIKVVSFNNPSSQELGFSLELEIQAALKPLLAKAKNTNPAKFSSIVSSLFQSQGNQYQGGNLIMGFNPLLASIFSLVGTLTVQEKNITKEDLDSFLVKTSRYFMQYQKLHSANVLFDQNVEKLISKMAELKFDIREFMIDLVTIINYPVLRNQVKDLNEEDLYLKFMEGRQFQYRIAVPMVMLLEFPSDGIKTAKEIAYALQKLFAEYQKIYTENYLMIKSILLESRSLSSSINQKQVDLSLKELEILYEESRQSDVLGLRLNTLFERLRLLVGSEQPVRR